MKLSKDHLDTEEIIELDDTGKAIVSLRVSEAQQRAISKLASDRNITIDQLINDAVQDDFYPHGGPIDRPKLTGFVHFRVGIDVRKRFVFGLSFSDFVRIQLGKKYAQLKKLFLP